MPSHVLTSTYTRSGEQITANVTVTADGEKNLSIALTAAQSDKSVAFSCIATNLQSVYIKSDVNCILETNASSGTSTGNTLTLVAAKPLLWYTGCGMTCPITTDVTVLFATNSNTSTTGAVEVRVLEDV